MAIPASAPTKSRYRTSPTATHQPCRKKTPQICRQSTTLLFRMHTTARISRNSVCAITQTPSIASMPSTRLHQTNPDPNPRTQQQCTSAHHHRPRRTRFTDKPTRTKHQQLASITTCPPPPTRGWRPPSSKPTGICRIPGGPGSRIDSGAGRRGSRRVRIATGRAAARPVNHWRRHW